MFRLVSLNLNGIRSAATKGLVPWAEALGADCMGVQEIKAQQADVAGRFERLHDLHGHFHFAEKKGYSGVGLFTALPPRLSCAILVVVHIADGGSSNLAAILGRHTEPKPAPLADCEGVRAVMVGQDLTRLIDDRPGTPPEPAASWVTTRPRTSSSST